MFVETNIIINMKENKKPRHVVLPRINPGESEVTPKERLVYLYIKAHMNKHTKEAFPSLQTLKDESGVSIPTLRKCIAILNKNGFISTRKEGRKQIYKFNDTNKFEEVSFDLLYNKNISFTEKQVIICSLENMLDKGTTGKINYSNRVLSEIINMPESTISKSFRGLENKGYMTVIKHDSRDLETGSKKETKLVNLEKLGQAIIYKLKEHEDRITQNEQTVNRLEKELAEERKARQAVENSFKLVWEKLSTLTKPADTVFTV